MSESSSPSATHYRYEFDDTGGYDCMYGAFFVKDSAGKTVFEVDLRHYDQRPCDWDDPIAKAKAEEVARRVVDALNATLTSIPSEIAPKPGDITREALLEANAKQVKWIEDLQRDLAAATRQACTSEHRTTCSFAPSAMGERCAHGVWKADHCWTCNPGKQDSACAEPEPVPMFGQPEARLEFLKSAGQGCISGNVSEWPQLRLACRWAAEQISARPTLELDAQRLDWIEEKRATVSFADVAPEHGSPGGPHVCANSLEPLDDANHYYGATYREAIDKAMKGTNS